MSAQILQNIRDDAAAYIRAGKAMPERGAQWNEAVRLAIEEERKLHEQEALAELEGLERKLAEKCLMSYDEWLAKAKKLYSIDPTTSVVTSIAHGPDHAKTWEEENQVAARRRVYKLMVYKKYDHFQRGCDFFYDPDGEKKNA